MNGWVEEDIFYNNSNLNYVIRANYSWGIEDLKNNQLLRIQPVCQVFNMLADIIIEFRVVFHKNTILNIRLHFWHGYCLLSLCQIKNRGITHENHIEK